MRNRGLSRASLAKKSEPTFELGIFDPLDDIFQNVFPCAWKTALLIAE